jgi:predicted DNA-binding WGR domain protein
MVRGLLKRQTGFSIGVVAFSEAQQGEIEEALSQLTEEDGEFGNLLEAEYTREENDVFCGLFVKNLENVQGDERDIIILSVCYAPGVSGRMLMNFGPINQSGGEKRLNVIFSRAKHHMAVVSSIRHSAITNDFNDGANSLKNFLHYAESISNGDPAEARRILENLDPTNRKRAETSIQKDFVVESLAAALRLRGYVVETHVGQSKFRCDLALRKDADTEFRLGIIVDTDAHYSNANMLDRYLYQPSILRAFNWNVTMVLTRDWYLDSEDVLNRIEKLFKGELVREAVMEPEIEKIAVPQKPTESIKESAGKPLAGKVQKTSQIAHGKNADKSKPAKTEKSTVRYFEFGSGSSSKFWEISIEQNAFTVRFGKRGSSGQSQTKRFSDEAKVLPEAEKLIAEKIRKGYVQKNRA